MQLTVAALSAGRKWYSEGNPGVAANMGHLFDLARDAVEENADIVVFPEYATTGCPYPPADEVRASAETIPGSGRWYDAYASFAASHQVWLAAWLVELDGGCYLNTAFLIDEEGTFRGKYRKVHLSNGEMWAWGFSGGQELAPLDTPWGRVGFFICADRWYPEHARCLLLSGADFFIHPSVGDDGDMVNQVRCLENRVWTVNASYAGGSIYVSPRGDVVAKADSGVGRALILTMDPNETLVVRNTGGPHRAKLTFRAARRPELYGTIIDTSLPRPSWRQVFCRADGSDASDEELSTRVPYLLRSGETARDEGVGL